MSTTAKACSVGLCVAHRPIYRVVRYIRFLPTACLTAVSHRSALVVITSLLTIVQ